MHNVWKKLLAMTLCTVMILPVASCGKTTDKPAKDTEQNVSKNSYFGEVWSAPSTVKVQQNDISYAQKGEMELSYKVVRNEYESQQLLITAEKDVKQYELVTSDLKNGDAVLSADNIEVYMERYVTFTDHYGTDLCMPDALIPMETAKAYEENSIKAEKNGALWITIYVPKETVPGDYEGTFQLKLAGGKKEETLDVPVTVKVYDYTLTDEITAKTLFSWRYDRVAAGELDHSNEMMVTYYEFFQDYRISLQSMPLESLTGDEYAANVLKYYDELSTYSLLKAIGDVSNGISDAREKVIEQILAVAAVCPEDKNLFDKAIVYPTDEPDLKSKAARDKVISLLTAMRNIFEECVEIISSDQTGKYASFKKHRNWQQSIRDITMIIPTTVAAINWMQENKDTEDGKALLNAYDCVCPGFGNFTESGRTAIEAFCEEFDMKLWWYGCCGPYAPAPTYHIGDSNLLSARAVSWLQQIYQIGGNLYWDAAAYTDEAQAYYNEYINMYEHPFRGSNIEWPAGDGNLCYPGAKYGIYGPLPSMRLMSIRDGMEEYEILNDLEAALKENSKAFGSDFSVEKAMQGFCDSLAFDGIKISVDGQQGFDFDVVRTNLLNAIVGLKDNLGFALTDIEYGEDTISLTYYVQPGVKVQIGGQEQVPVSGQKYQYEIPTGEKEPVQFVLTNTAGQTAVYGYCMKTVLKTVTNFGNQADLEAIEVSNESSVELYKDGSVSNGSVDGISAHFNIKGVVTGDVLTDASFKPFLSIDVSTLGEENLAKFSTLYIDYINMKTSFDFIIKLYQGDDYYELDEYSIPYGVSSLLLEFGDLDKEMLKATDRIVFEFANKTGNEATNYDFYLDGIRGQVAYELEGGE